MSDNISFKNYVLSKQRLKDALQESPFQICNYEAIRYIKFDSVDEMLSVRPKHRFIVEWTHPDNKDPVCERIILITPEGSQSLTPNVSGARLMKWFASNTKQID